MRVLAVVLVMCLAKAGFAQNCADGRCSPLPVVASWQPLADGTWMRNSSVGWVHYDPASGLLNTFSGGRWGGWTGDIPAVVRDTLPELPKGACGCGDGCKCPPGACPEGCQVKAIPGLPTGVVSERLNNHRYHYNGERVSKAFAVAKMADSVPDLANKWRIVVVGNDDFRKAALAKIGKPDTAAINAFAADHWYAKSIGLESPAVYVLKPDGEQVALVKDTGTALDAALLAVQTAPDKWQPPKLPNESPSVPFDPVIRVPLPSWGNVWGALFGIVAASLAHYFWRLKGISVAKPQIKPVSTLQKGW